MEKNLVTHNYRSKVYHVEYPVIHYITRGECNLLKVPVIKTFYYTITYLSKRLDLPQKDLLSSVEGMLPI